MSKFLYHLS